MTVGHSLSTIDRLILSISSRAHISHCSTGIGSCLLVQGFPFWNRWYQLVSYDTPRLTAAWMDTAFWWGAVADGWYHVLDYLIWNAHLSHVQDRFIALLLQTHSGSLAGWYPLHFSCMLVGSLACGWWLLHWHWCSVCCHDLTYTISILDWCISMEVKDLKEKDEDHCLIKTSMYTKFKK